jgi:hypothetical protein
VESVSVRYLLTHNIINPYTVEYWRVANRLADVNVQPGAWCNAQLRQLERYNPCVLQALLQCIESVWIDPQQVCKLLVHFQHLDYLNLVERLLRLVHPEITLVRMDGDTKAEDRDAGKVLLDHPTCRVVVLSTVSAMGANYVRLWHLIEAELFASAENRTAVQRLGRALRRLHHGQKPKSRCVYLFTEPGNDARLVNAVERFANDHRQSLVNAGFIKSTHQTREAPTLVPATADGWGDVFGEAAWVEVREHVSRLMVRMRTAKANEDNEDD